MPKEKSQITDKQQRDDDFVWWKKWSTRSAKMCQESPRSCKYDNNVQSSGSGIAFEMLPIHPCALDGNVALKYDNVLSHKR